MPPSSHMNEDLFFFSQSEPRKKLQRTKKQLDEQTLNNLAKRITSKFQISEEEHQQGIKRSLTDRLADLYKLNSGTVGSTSSNGSATSSASSRNSIVATPPQAFTDTRLQAIRFLTEDMIRELEETLLTYIELQAQPILPGAIIYELHNDWSDLTDGVSYRNFPVWQTKAAKDSLLKRSAMNTTGKNISRISHTTEISTKNESDKNKSNNTGIKAIIKPNITKLSAISETRSKTLVSINNVPEQMVMKTNRTNSTTRKGSALNKAQIEMVAQNISRISSAGGCSVNYQLSNNQFKDKGWTVVASSEEDQMGDIERRILFFLNTATRNIEDIKKFNEKYGLVYKSKIRYYGQYKKEQLEKYKISSNLKPKKSQFAMCILRYEIPKPLDANLLIETLFTPYTANQLNRTKSAYPNKNLNLQQQQQPIQLQNHLAPVQTSLGFNSNESYNTKTIPPILNTQTNDGTTCVFYPNGQKAILIANVFGFSVETTSSMSSHQNHPQSSSQAHNNLTSMSGSFNSSNVISGSNLTWQSMKNSYSTIIYDMNNESNRKTSKYSFKSLLSLSSSITTARDENDKKVVLNIKPNRHEARILAVITSTGNCVYYRDNGKPRFVCTELGGCLCNKQGASYYQWRWDDMRQSDYEIVKNELVIDLNEFIRLEYRNPTNIKVKFNCNKESMSFDLGLVKENQQKLNDFLNRTASNVPMKSTLGQLKINLAAKASAIMSYKTKHLQEQQLQQQASQSVRKTSIFNQSVSSHDSKIDRLLDTTISYKDVPVMKELLVIQKRIRTILEEWLIHCRSSLGVLSPNLYIFPDFPIKHKTTRLNEDHKDFNKIVLYKRKSRSVLDMTTSTPLSMNTSSFLLNKTKNHLQFTNSSLNLTEYQVTYDPSGDLQRSKSAYITRKTTKLSKQHEDLIERIREFKSHITKGNMYSNAFKKKHEQVLNNLASSFSTVSQKWQQDPTLIMLKSNQTPTTNTIQRMNNINYLINKRKNHLKSDQIIMDTNTAVMPHMKRSLSFENFNMLCPVSLHYRIGFDKHDLECRCRKHFVPFVSDIEYDALIKLLPAEQLLVICVIDSFITPTQTQKTIESMYLNYNKNRSQPCKDSAKDDVRFLFYDLRTSIDDSDHTQPLLVTRHNVSAGMVLIYKNSKLLFCDHIFNGYGFSQQDLLKQLSKCKEDADLGKSLPYNFRFSYSIGKFGKRTPWGGQIIGQPLENGSKKDEIVPFLQGSSTFRSLDSNVPNSIANNSTNDSERIHLPKINKLLTSSS